MPGLIDLTDNPRLIVETQPTLELPFRLEVIVGRDPTCKLTLAQDTEVSRRHARFFAEGDAYYVEDMGSRNGTYLNNERIAERRRLREGDLVVVGRTRIRFLVEPTRTTTNSRPGEDILHTIQASADEVMGPRTGEPVLDAAWVRLRALYGVSEAVATLQDEQQIGANVLMEVFRVLPSERGAIFLLEAEDRLRPLAAIWHDGAADSDPAISRTVLRYVLAHKVALVTADAASDPRLAAEREGLLDSVYLHNIRSAACVPLMFRDRILGILQILAEAPGQTFSEEDLRLLTGMACQTAVALESARLARERQQMINDLLSAQGELQSRIDQLRILYEIEQQLSSTDDMETFLGSVVRQATVHLKAEAGSIFLLQEETDRITFAYPSGGREQLVKHKSFERGRGIAGHVVSSGEPILENDAPSNPHFDAVLSRAFGIEVKNLVAVPLVVQEGGRPKVVGALEVLNKKKEEAFTSADLQVLSFLGAQATSGILRKRLTEEKAKAERLGTIGMMAGSIIHDFKNPMSIIRGFVELIQGGEPDDKTRRRYTQIILAEIDRCVNMTREILHFVRGDKNFNFQEVGVPDFVADLSLVLENELKGANVDFVRKIEYDGPLRLDVEKMKRVIFNFSNNSLSAMPDGGTFTLEFRKVGQEVEIRISDTGPGIPPELRPKLFSPFATFGKKEGTGLGLCIAKDIVDGHGGRLFLDTSVQQGACFVIRMKPPPST